MSRDIRGALRGLPVLDAGGRVTGRVELTYPLDGGAPEFAIVRVRRFGRRVMVPLEGAVRADGVLTVPYARDDLEDAPALDASRYFDDALSRTRGYWSLVEGEEPARLTPMPLG